MQTKRHQMSFTFDSYWILEFIKNFYKKPFLKKKKIILIPDILSLVLLYWKSLNAQKNISSNKIRENANIDSVWNSGVEI